ncbi:MAG: hypothetical protein RJQ14_18120 [Marinoscillum sp.]
MKSAKIHLEITIAASKEHIWCILLGHETFSQWATAFKKGSYFEGEITKEGGIVSFLDPDQNGIRSRVMDYKQDETITFLHHAILNRCTLDTASREAKKWIGLKETYLLKALDNNKCLFTVDVDIAVEYEEMFAKSWKRAMENLKRLCEF